MPEEDNHSTTDLRCETCGQLEALGDVEAMLARGWPKCCGKPMQWVGKRPDGPGEGAAE